MTLGQHQEAFAYDVMRLFSFLHANDYSIRIGEAQRTQEQQQLYFQRGLSKTMNSMHLQKCAIDLFIFDKEHRFLQDKASLSFAGAYWESLSDFNRWGGNFKSFTDTPHFERNINKK